MALEIKENRGLFEISGRVTSQNLNALKIYFDSILESTDIIVVSIENVDEMDSAAALFFERLYRGASLNNKVVSIVGEQNNNIAEVMKITNTNYILSSDRT